VYLKLPGGAKVTKGMALRLFFQNTPLPVRDECRRKIEALSKNWCRDKYSFAELPQHGHGINLLSRFRQESFGFAPQLHRCLPRPATRFRDHKI
jgi:hypothetical protein